MIEKRVHLREMTDKEFASFILYSREHQAACLKKEKGISAEEAYVEMEEELNKMLPNGKNTPGNYFMAICTQDDSVVGYMWYMHDTRRKDVFLEKDGNTKVELIFYIVSLANCVGSFYDIFETLTAKKEA